MSSSRVQFHPCLDSSRVSLEDLDLENPTERPEIFPVTESNTNSEKTTSEDIKKEEKPKSIKEIYLNPIIKRFNFSCYAKEEECSENHMLGNPSTSSTLQPFWFSSNPTTNMSHYENQNGNYRSRWGLVGTGKMAKLLVNITAQAALVIFTLRATGKSNSHLSFIPEPLFYTVAVAMSSGFLLCFLSMFLLDNKPHAAGILEGVGSVSAAVAFLIIFIGTFLPMK